MPPPTQPHKQQQPAGQADRATPLPRLELEPLRPLLEQLADLVADRVANQLTAQTTPLNQPPSRRLLTLDELIALLPPGKKPATWKGWLYQRTHLAGGVPGQHKLGGRLFFDPQQTLAWLLHHATEGPQQPRLDVAAPQSLHAQAMPHLPTQGPQQAGER